MGSVKSAGTRSIVWAVLAAALYALSTPASKLMLADLAPTMMAAFLYLGAGAGILVMGLIRRAALGVPTEHSLTRRDLPYAAAMVALDIAAPILLMTGLSSSDPASVSLLNNFEIVATSIIALVVFHEAVSRRLWLAIGLITLSSVVLSLEGADSLRFSSGSLLVLLACICWGFENNCTRKMSDSDPLQIVVVKGLGSGLGALLVAFAAGEALPAPTLIPAVLLLGFVSYGLSIFFYVRAQRGLGAARTSAFYAISPFIGAALSLLIFRELPSLQFLIALAIMAAGAALAADME